MRQVELVRAGAGEAPAGHASLRMAVDPQALAPLTRAVGKGRTIFLPGLADDEKLVASVLPASKDGRVDRRYVTETDGGVLWLDADEARIWRQGE